ncbi:DUF3014 domain-containing protein [Opacimonas viscosa]|uniref:DUF3014 domain-containing protein n=1 Tax=Opacimonas viscosa TaxID=2961944 RepID=A0AA41WYT9_9ALTE|nr:DUF3014 domain-containing protein [Opacimonas viscosa]MCP3429034.1 DUF3014 domain-containing protein [Opacimonas viscosa]
MTDQSNGSSKAPILIVVVVLAAILAVVFLWPKSETDVQPVASVLPTDVVAEPVLEPAEPVVEEELFTEDTFTVAELPPAVEVTNSELETPEFIEPVQVEEPSPEPLDVSDLAVKQSILAITQMPVLSTILINEGILDKVVATVLNTAENKISANTSLATAPSEAFSVFKQAGRLYIEPSAFTRYNVYAQTFAEVETDNLIALLDQYEPELVNKFTEIAPPGMTFHDAVLAAINVLLDTPIIKLPVEVSTNRAMYEFTNPQLEALSPPQKQLLRMGPYNVRIVKRKLRELREALADRAQ